MFVLASNFGGPYALPIGCCMLLLLPVVGMFWTCLQIYGLLNGDRLRWWSVAFILLFSVVPAYFVAVSLHNHGAVNGIWTFLEYAAIFGLVLVPCTVIRELLKRRRDLVGERQRRRGERRRDKDDEIETTGSYDW